jgi:hypothetical protein
MTDDGFSPEEERLLADLLDEIVPPSGDGRLPGAGALGVTAHIARTVQQTPMLRPVVEYGLSALAELAGKRGAASFAALSRRERRELFEEFAATDQFFLPAFLFLTYSGYYQDARVVAALGLEPRAPHPEGHAMEEDDLTLLDPVRRRGRMYRTD